MPNQQPGTLYVCATPIGNLEDITLRVLRVLAEADFVAAEDTRHTLKLLTHFEIKKPLVSYHEHNKHVRGPELLTRLLQGESCALVSDAGLPGISDPGADMVRLCIDNAVPVTVCPGASAALTAAVLSGLDNTRLAFDGFLPHGRHAKKERAARIESLRSERRTIVLYESPHRIAQTLKELLDALGDREAAAARELTKRYEEVKRGTLSTLLLHFTNNEPKGEFALIIAGETGDMHAEPDWSELPIPAHVAQCMAQGLREMDAIKAVAKARGLSKREVYAAVKITEE